LIVDALVVLAGRLIGGVDRAEAHRLPCIHEAIILQVLPFCPMGATGLLLLLLLRLR
jgi:hypothetical protein